MLENIRIVLINTFHPGNIGSAARAMKNMGLSQLYLVDPQQFPATEATAMAAGAKDVLANVVITETLAEAIQDCSLVIGTSARQRTHSWPMLSARECGEKVITEAPHQPVALVFGRETMGLHNEELQQCNYHAYIPANPEYPVLNLATAVQTISYEIYQAYLAAQQYPDDQSTTNAPAHPSNQQMEYFYQHLEQVLADTGFILKQHPGQTMLKLRRLFNRARPERQELSILRGILSSIEKPQSKELLPEKTQPKDE
ncbi:tRNA (cytosine(32)/uridine(32)-2'-O)-methyltransferase TrmJ [Endozoicomonas sp. SM1973]|uniref:tRNA (cytidine/uridine-2'-O-)-methyltransferase TrmJ n=1 Tax=Spartinivicinus marinus TaxID=2994442 RepID=A0A853IDD6_9GAMM|nr:tRNA (cytosine(32)/uridine(32)-2'-O)-methyltransferase TrmJ [Spartinivicinus marinus]MCX4028528.1 tRNA (cytosine(32)/uridine(32)-2'-O)-methyltransferase TrmJ [Spartinivicinus marinus]NYZ67195.1 tRNA (cytosine(32)/uridine(32)-2'-O)-methyltransferase TrmJ [Spartinivicinus marinus]